MKHIIFNKILFFSFFPLLLSCSANTLGQSSSAHTAQQLASMFAETLAERLLLATEPSGLNVEVSLFFASSIDLEQFRNAKSIVNPDGLSGTRHEFFIAFDGMFPLAGGHSVLTAYETIVNTAKCIEGAQTFPGCILHVRALEMLNTPRFEPSLFRSSWPEWRPIDVNPEDWAENKTLWKPLTIKIGKSILTTEYIYINLLRGWFSENFLVSSSWYIPGLCRGQISDGDSSNDTINNEIQGNELLPRIPTGLILTRKLVITDGDKVKLNLNTTHLSGWTYKKTPISPKYSDPNIKSCIDDISIKLPVTFNN